MWNEFIFQIIVVKGKVCFCLDITITISTESFFLWMPCLSVSLLWLDCDH